jgi:hypothetical protein
VTQLTQQAARDAVTEFGGYRQAARALGVPYTTLHNAANRGRRRAPKQPSAARQPPAAPAVHVPRLLSGEEPIEEILRRRERQFDLAAKAAGAEAWFPIHVADTKPVGVLWFGDPHIDDDGCNIRLLRRHAQICATTPGLYGVNIGDSTNNWAGRLARLYADQETSRRTARRLAKWFLCESGIEWLVWLMGNHDEWESGAEILRGMNGRGIVMQDWDARFRFVFPGAKDIRVHAAHDFKGHSFWNVVHGPAKFAKLETDAELLVCGHKHDWGISQFEMAGRHRVATVLRCRGYKWHDHYARVHGFQSAQSGAAILTILNPWARDPAGRVLTFSDVEAGAAVLAALRAA